MEKTKRKGNPEKANRRFAIVLVGFIVISTGISVSIVVVGNHHHLPLIALQKPFTHLTPILYSLISLMWVPIAFQQRRVYGLDKRHWLLTFLCILSVTLMTWFQFQLFAYDGWCWPDFEPIRYTPLAIFKGWECAWVLF